MKKSNRYGLLVLGIALLAFMVSGGTGCGGGSSDSSAVAEGKTLLAESNGEDAREIFADEVASDPDSCPGHYGRLLADAQCLAKEASDLLATAGGTLFSTESDSPAAVYPSAASSGVDLYGMLDVALQPFLELIEEMEADADRIAELNCTFKTDSYPMTLSTGDDEPVASVELSGVWGKPEALLVGGVVHMAVAMVDYVSAHNLVLTDLAALESLINLSGWLEKFQSGVEANSIIQETRSLGALIEANPDFLTKNTGRWDMMEEVPVELAEGFSEYAAIFDALENDERDPAEAIVGLTDVDGNGFDAGDELSFGLVKGSFGGGTTLVEGLKILIPDYFTAAVMADARELLENVEDAMDAAVDGGTSERIALAEFNSIFNIFSSEIETMIPLSDFMNLLPMGPIASLPDVVELDLQAFLTDPKPLRDFLPARESSVPNNIMVEGEVDTAGIPAGASIKLGDVQHFAGTAYQIDNDCITALADTVVNPIPYIALPDPSFNGLIWVNLGPLATYENAGTCSDTAGFQKADNYSINKLIAAVMISTTELPDTWLPF